MSKWLVAARLTDGSVRVPRIGRPTNLLGFGWRCLAVRGSLRRTAIWYLALAALAMFAGALQAQENVPTRPFAEVPEIGDYIRKQGSIGFGHNDITVAKVDLSVPPDGRAEYIVFLNEPCGSGGCAVDVLSRSANGEFQRLAGILMYGFGLGYSATNGMRDLLSEGKSGKMIWRFDGRTYRPRKGHPKSATRRPKSRLSDAGSPSGQAAKGSAPSSSKGTAEPPLDPAGLDLRPYENAPEIREFVRRLGRGRSMVGTMVARFDIDAPADGKKEYIIRVGVANFCQDGACEYKIVRLDANGRAKEIFSSGVTTMRFSLTSSNGHRDLVTENAYGRYLWKYDGRYYQSIELQRAKAVSPIARAKPRIAGCIGEYGWRSGRERGRRAMRGYAVFGSCTDPINMALQFNCGDGERGVQVQFDTNPEQSGPITIIIDVDGQKFQRLGATVFSELAGGHLPVFKLGVNDPLFRALARGRVATVVAGKARLEMHLNGASKALRTMLRACRR